MSDDLVARIDAHIEKYFLTRKEYGVALGLAMIPPPEEMERLLIAIRERLGRDAELLQKCRNKIADLLGITGIDDLESEANGHDLLNALDADRKGEKG